jgi:Ca2+-binding EF-hand superfamily protein
VKQLCTGHVTKTQFRQCLTYLKANVTDEEFEVLCKRFGKPAGKSDDEAVDEEDIVVEVDPIKKGAERICYLMFLNELENSMMGIPPAACYNPSLHANLTIPSKPSAANNESRTLAPSQIAKKFAAAAMGLQVDTEKLLLKLKSKAKTERIRVIDFMQDFDDLRHGRISKNEFRRALKVLYLDLTEVSVSLFISCYAPIFKKQIGYLLGRTPNLGKPVR